MYTGFLTLLKAIDVKEATVGDRRAAILVSILWSLYSQSHQLSFTTTTTTTKYT